VEKGLKTNYVSHFLRPQNHYGISVSSLQAAQILILPSYRTKKELYLSDSMLSHYNPHKNISEDICNFSDLCHHIV